MNPLLSNIRGWASLTVLAGAVFLLHAASGFAQQDQIQYVDSLDSHRLRIEGLINERLLALVPTGNYVMRAFVTGSKSRLSGATFSGPILDLPGFRPSVGETVGGEEKFRVDQVVVRIVIHQDISLTDLQYIRTVVPILADFRPERGDRLDVQLISPTSSLEEAAGFEPGGFPKEESLTSSLGLEERPFGLSWVEWILVGMLALLILIMFIVVMRTISRPKEPPRQAEPSLPSSAVLAAAAAQDSRVEKDKEQQKMEQERQMDEIRHSVVKHLFARPELGRELISSWQGNAVKLNALIHALGPEISRQAIMPHTGREQYQELEETVRQEQAPDSTRLMGALREANLFLLTREITHPELLLPNPFRFLDILSWGQVAHLIKEEPVKVKAIVLSRIKPEDTARILETLPKDLQLEIAAHIGNLHDMPLEMAESVATDLAEKARHVPDARLVDVDGPSALVDLMGRTSSETSRYLLEAMRSKDTKLSEEIDKRFFMFEAIPLVPEEVMPQAVRTLPSNTVIMAMQGAAQDIQRKVIMAFPENARTGLVTALHASRGDPEMVADARRQVVNKFQELARQGRIDLKQISDAWQAQAKAS